MIILVGSGYIGKAIADELWARNLAFRWANHNDTHLIGDIEQHGTLVINAAAFVTKPSVDLCKNQTVETVQGNIIFPSKLALACKEKSVPLIHFSTGCLFDDKKEYSENDSPTRDLNGYCGFYLASKLAAEGALSTYPNTYILRIRIPFDHLDHPQNYLTKLRDYPQVWNHTNSLTHRGDCAKAALDLWEKAAPYGTYNLTNPGIISAAEIVKMAGWTGKVFTDGPVTGTHLSVDKLLATGVKIRPVREAVEESLRNWHV